MTAGHIRDMYVADVLCEAVDCVDDISFLHLCVIHVQKQLQPWAADLLDQPHQSTARGHPNSGWSSTVFNGSIV